MDEEQKHYEEITRESLFRIRALYPLIGEKASLRSDKKPWGKESFQKNKKEFLSLVKGSGKTLEYFGTSEEEMQLLEARIEAIHWLQLARSGQKNRVFSDFICSIFKFRKWQEKQIIDFALKSVGSSLEEIKKL